MSQIIRLIKAFEYSAAGLKAVWEHEAAFRVEVTACALLIPLSFFLHVSHGQHMAMIGSLFLVLIVEVINSAIEATVDRISDEHHPLSGRAKDMGSAAVLLALLNAATIWAVSLFL